MAGGVQAVMNLHVLEFRQSNTVSLLYIRTVCCALRCHVQHYSSLWGHRVDFLNMS